MSILERWLRHCAVVFVNRGVPNSSFQTASVADRGPERGLPDSGLYLRSAVFVGLLIATHGSFAAQIIGVDFRGRDNNSAAVTSLTPTQTAGVVPQANWNSIDDNAVNNNGTSSASNNSTGTATLVDSTGAITPATVTFTANDSWNNDTDPSTITSANARMMNGIMKASTGTSQTLTWNNLTGSSYDIYLYLNENGDGTHVSVDGGNGTVYYLTETHQFTDASRFIGTSNTDPAQFPLANYVKFTALAPTDGKITIVLTHISGSDGAGLAGMQLVTPSGDTPITIVTQPLSQTAAVGNSVTFGVAAYGENQKFQWYKGATQISNATNSFYTTAPVIAGDNGSTYHVVVSNGVNSQTSSNATLTVKPATDVVGYLRHEYYPNATRTDLETGIAGAPSFVEAVSSFVTPINDGINNFSERISGYFTPPADGNYVFFIAADDDADFFISTDANPLNKKLVAQETAWSNTREWTVSGGNSSLTQKRSDQFSPDGGATTPYAEGIALHAGTPYYIEGVHHQGGGGDNFSVTYKLIADADPISADPANSIAGDATLLTNSVISIKTTTTTSLSISQPPVDQTVTEGFIGTFTVTAQTDSELRPKYQWLRNGVAIPGANGPSYSFNATAADNLAKYSVEISVPGYATTITSGQATLTVRSPVFTGGFLKYELWNGKNRADVENGNAGAPTSVAAISVFQTANNAGDPPSNYADRVSGFFIPAVDGDYVFFIGSDDDSDLFLSTDDTAANKKLIAQETGYSSFSNWNTVGAGTASEKRSDTFSASAWPTPNVITLQANHRYYIEAAHHEGTGGDWLGVYVVAPGASEPADGTPSNLRGSNIGFLVAPATVNISQQPASVSATEGWTATFSVTATTDSQVNIVSYQWRRNGSDIPGANGPTYTTQPLSSANNNDQYSVVVNAPGATAKTSSVATLTVTPGVLSVGFLKYELWPGKVRSDILAGTTGIASATNALVSLTSTNNAGDPPSNYADRISGFFIPPSNGNYVFFLGSDDDSDLYLSTDANPANKKLIARETGWSGYLNWTTVGATSLASDKRSDQFATSEWPTPNVITLTANQRYYIEVDHHEGTGGDWAGATWVLEGNEPANGSPSTLTGTNVAFFARSAATLNITQQPVTASVADGWSATFKVAATTDSEFNIVTYQWQLNGVDIPGATGSSYTTPALTSASSTDKYRVIVRAPGAAPVMSVEVGVSAQTPAFTAGYVKHEVWNGVTDRTLVETDAAGAPNIVESLTMFQTPNNAGDPPSGYVDRLSGFFVPATDGNYVFFLGSDDDSDLFLSTDDSPANKKLIAQEAGYSGYQNWTVVGGNGSLASDKRSDTFANSEWPTPNTISLLANHRYYIEAVHHEGTGGDWVGVYAKLASAADPVSGTTPSNLTGSIVGAVIPPPQNTSGPQLSITHSGSTVTVSWTGSGTLQQATTLTGHNSDWTNVTPAPSGSSFTTSATTGMQFFRVVR